MASLNQGSQNKNLVMHRGKAGERPKQRKALGDITNIPKPPVSNRVRKDLSSETKSSGSIKSTQMSDTLTKVWAQEGREHIYFTGNEIQKLERDCMDKNERRRDEKKLDQLLDESEAASQEIDFKLDLKLKDFSDTNY